MDDSEVINVFNKEAVRTKKLDTVSFIFSLKNRIGGLARALRVFQVFIFIFLTNLVSIC